MKYPTIERRKVHEELAKHKWKRCGEIYSKASSLEEYIIKRDTEGYQYRWNILDPYIRFYYFHQRPWLLVATGLALIAIYIVLEVASLVLCSKFGLRNCNHELIGVANIWVAATIPRFVLFIAEMVFLFSKNSKDMARADKNDMSAYN